MGIAWKYIRVPADLHAELRDLCRDYDRLQTEGRAAVPSEFADNRGAFTGTPCWYAIRLAVAAFRDKRKRSAAKPAAKPAARPGQFESAC